MNKLISIVVPVYNSELYLKRTMDSLINQTYKNIEIILINDGSKDNSLEVCKEYERKDKRIRVYTQDNCGVSKTRNNGIEHAGGEYIMFVDSDDYIEENMIYDMANSIKPNVELVISGIKMNYIENEKIIKTEEYTLLDKVYSKEEFINDLLKNIEMICFCGPCCKLYKKDILKRYNIRFDEMLTMGEDTWYNIDYLQKCSKKIVTLGNIYYNYMRENKNSLYSKYYDQYIKMTEKVYNKFLNFLNKEANKTTIMRFTKTYIINLVYANAINFKYKTTLKKKLEDIKYSLNNKIVRENIENIEKVNFREKVYCYFIKYKLKYCLFLYFKLKTRRIGDNKK